MKKMLSLALCLLLTFTAIPQVRADGENLSAGQKLFKMGLVKGDQNGDLLEQQSLKRQDALLLLLRLLGEDKKADAYTGKTTFQDVKETSYYYSAVAYAENEGLTKGMGDGSFGSDRLVTEKEMLNFILRTLNHKDVAWDDVMFKARELKLTEGLSPDANANALRAKVFEYMLAGLNTKVNGTDQKLGAKLGIKEFMNEDEEYTGKFGVKSIAANGLKAFEIKFTDPIKNYDVDKTHIKVDKMSFELRLQEDGKTVSVFFLNPVKQDAKIKVMIDGVRSKKGKSIDKFEKEFKMEDSLAPSLLDAKFMDLKTLKLTFSEPMRVSSQSFGSNKFLEIDGEKPNVRIDKNKMGDELLITFKDELKAGTHKLKLANLKDYAGNELKEEELERKAERDNSEPKATRVDFLNSKKVMVYFDEPIYERGLFKIDENFAGSKKYYDDNKSVIELSFPNEINLAALNNGVLLYKGQEDRSKNKVKDWEKISFEVDDDTTLPEAKMSLDSDNKVRLEFDKPMNAAYGRVILFDKDKKKLEEYFATASQVHAFEKDSHNRVLKVAFKNAKFNGQNSEQFYIRAEGFRDLSLRGNQMIAIEEKFESKDAKKPTLVYSNGKGAVKVTKSANSYKEDTISIRFSEPMNEDDLRNLANYRVPGIGQLSGVDGASIEGIYDDDKTVVIVVPNARKISSTGKFTILGMRDKAGNLMDTVEDATIIAKSSFRLNSAVAIKKNEILLNYSKEVEVFDPGAYVIKRNNDDVDSIVSYEIDKNNKKQVKVTLDKGFGSSASGYQMVVLDEAGVKSVFGEELGSTSAVSISDQTGASVEEIEATGGKFIVKMSESILFKEGDPNSVTSNILIYDSEKNLLKKGDDYTVNKQKSSDPDYVKNFEIKGVKGSSNTFKEGETYTIELIATWNSSGVQSYSYSQAVTAVGAVE